MKSLDQAVNKFKILKQKLKTISEQTSKNPFQTNKQNVSKLSNTVCAFMPLTNKNSHLNVDPIKKLNIDHKKSNQSIKPDKIIYQDIVESQNNQENKLHTQKKGRHNKKQSYSLNQSYKEVLETKPNPLSSRMLMNIIGPIKSSRIEIDHRSRQKTLEQINDLLQQKRQILEVLEKKIGASALVKNLSCEIEMSRGKRIIKAPNLFQMQAQGRKRSNSKTLTMRWK